jgi:glycosyltransferase involved in cell wall biosynthesis
MRILLLHKYGQLNASYRYRMQQYIPLLEKNGIQCVVSPLLDDDYLTIRHGGKGRNFWFAAKALFRRFKILSQAHRFDAVWVGVEILPYFPAFFEHYLAWRGVRYIYDFDDAIFHYYDLSRSRCIRWILGSKIQTVAKLAEVSFAGNEYLAKYVRAVSPRVEVLPTVIDLKHYDRVKTSFNHDKPLVIGWIGSFSTASYVETISGALAKFCAATGARVVLVGAGEMRLPGVPLEIRPWTAETELRDILSFDIGIMPLTDDAWCRGKCGFKLIQYMACGLPVIASPVGVNTEIVRVNENGYLASTEEEWTAALFRFEENRELLSSMGAAGRKRVEQDYCIEATGHKIVKAFLE